MYKFIILAATVGGLVFAGSLVESSNNETKYDHRNQFCSVEDTSKDEYKIERRRRGKGSKGRRRGGSGLR